MKSALRASALAFAAATAMLTMAAPAEARPNNRIVHIDENTGHGYWDGRNDGIVCSYGWRWRYSPYVGDYIRVRGRTCGRYW